MAIINLSPDSFSGDGVVTPAALRARLEAAIAGGADVLDLGGQSTRPGAREISVEEELARVLPAVSLARQLTDLPLSVDTFKPAVARAALGAGASMINDVHGATEPGMVEFLAQTTAPVVIMHSRGTSETMATLTDYPRGVVAEVTDYFGTRTAELIAAGIATERIIIDPGIGFAKTPAQSFELTQALSTIAGLGFPVLYGASRKSFLGRALANGDTPAPVDRREAATAATTAFAMLAGVAYVRVHDATAARDIRRVLDCIADPSLLDPRP